MHFDRGHRNAEAIGDLFVEKSLGNERRDGRFFGGQARDEFSGFDVRLPCDVRFETPLDRTPHRFDEFARIGGFHEKVDRTALHRRPRAPKER